MKDRIEIIPTDSNQFTVIVGGVFADRLTVDEALGVVASALFRPEKPPLYARSYEQWMRFNSKYNINPPVNPIALLTCFGGLE